MCTMTNANIVEDVIQDWVAKNQMFTAYDVTTQAKSNGADEQHYQMKGIVHDNWAYGFFSRNNYDRTLIDVGDKIQPWLYHPIGADISSYTDRFKQAIADRDGTDPATDSDDGIAQPDAALSGSYDDDTDTDTQSQSVVSSPTIIVGAAGGGATVVSKGGTKAVSVSDGKMDVDPKVKEKRPVDVEGRLNITRKLLKQAELQVDDGVIVDYKSNTNTLRIWKVDSNTDSQYKINADYRLRIGPNVLKSLKNDDDHFVVEVYDNHIEIKLP